MDDLAYRTRAWTASEKRKEQIRERLRKVQALTDAHKGLEEMREQLNRTAAKSDDEEMWLLDQLRKAKEELERCLGDEQKSQ